MASTPCQNGYETPVFVKKLKILWCLDHTFFFFFFFFFFICATKCYLQECQFSHQKSVAHKKVHNKACQHAVRGLVMSCIDNANPLLIDLQRLQKQSSAWCLRVVGTRVRHIVYSLYKILLYVYISFNNQGQKYLTAIRHYFQKPIEKRIFIPSTDFFHFVSLYQLFIFFLVPYILVLLSL